MGKYKELTSQATKSNPETAGRFHTNWLNMMYPRLMLARNLLKDDGVIFISIDDNEVHNLRKICDELFGEENFVGQFTRKGSGGSQDSRHYANIHEYILCYARDVQYYVSGKAQREGEVFAHLDEDKQLRYNTQLLRKWGRNSKRSDRPNLYYAIKDPDNNDHYPKFPDGADSCWRWGKSTMQEAIKNGKVEFKRKDDAWIAYEKIFEITDPEKNVKLFTTLIDEIGSATGASLLKEMFGEKMLDYPKPVDLIKKVLQIGGVKDKDIVLDFFSGSATTAHAVMQLNNEDDGSRKFIMVQLPEIIKEGTEGYKAGYKTIADIGRERIRRAGEKIMNANLDEAEKNSSMARMIDNGFKAFALDTSNIKSWDSTYNDNPNEVLHQIDNLLNTIKENRSDMDIATEVLLKLGIPLSAQVNKMEINKKYIYQVYNLVICLGDLDLQPNDIEDIIKMGVKQIIADEMAFANNTTLSNAHFICKNREVELKLL
jgi:adenine-specific DNA-methyltransferase